MLRLLPILLLTLAACRPDGSDGNGRVVVTDDLGREVAVPPDPRRLIPMAPNLTEIVAAAGGLDRIIAVSLSDNYPPETAALPRIGTLPIDLERIIDLRPDLLLANSAVNRIEDGERLAELRVPTYFFSFTQISDVPRALRRIGEMLGDGDAAEAAAQHFEQRVEAVRARSAERRRPRVLLLIGDETLWAFGAASYTQELIDAAGGESITAQFSGEGVTLSTEFVLRAAPDVIIGGWGDGYDPDRLVRLHPTLRAIPAVRNGRVHALDPDLLMRPGPRLADGVEAIELLLRDVPPEERSRDEP